VLFVFAVVLGATRAHLRWSSVAQRMYVLAPILRASDPRLLSEVQQHTGCPSSGFWPADRQACGVLIERLLVCWSSGFWCADRVACGVLIERLLVCWSSGLWCAGRAASGGDRDRAVATQKAPPPFADYQVLRAALQPFALVVTDVQVSLAVGAISDPAPEINGTFTPENLIVGLPPMPAASYFMCGRIAFRVSSSPLLSAFVPSGLLFLPALLWPRVLLCRHRVVVLPCVPPFLAAARTNAPPWIP